MKLIYLIPILLMINACDSLSMKKKTPTPKELELLSEAKESFKILPRHAFKSDMDLAKAAPQIVLGKKLYFEKRLSINGTISCNSCHKLDQFGVDNEATSVGHDGSRGGRNSPTVYNAALHIAQFWDGRAKDVEAQALGPLLNPIEHGLKSEKDALAAINTKEYKAMFMSAFRGENKTFSFNNIGRAIGAFERTLLTPSRFDDYLAGDVYALSSAEKKGLKKFMNVGCISCHDGAGIGGQQYQVLGAVEPFETKDMGRFDLTKNPDDKKSFKVPGLRNIHKTGPYFHDGSVKTLGSAIALMAKHQLGETLSKDDIKDIKTFLGSLTAKRLPRI